jgi:hypothetical protein
MSPSARRSTVLVLLAALIALLAGVTALVIALHLAMNTL